MPTPKTAQQLRDEIAVLQAQWDPTELSAKQLEALDGQLFDLQEELDALEQEETPDL